MPKSEAKHTPGPWNIDPIWDCRVNTPDGKRITDCSTAHVAVDVMAANARLIAAAPDLLAVSEIVAERGEHWIDCPMRFGTTVCCCPLGASPSIG